MRVIRCSSFLAKRAVEEWHYSHRMPSVVTHCYSVTEEGLLVGAVVFGYMAAPAASGRRYGVEPGQFLELQRVAMRAHDAPVSQVLAVAIRALRRDAPRIRLLFSFADPARGHHGGIYQAGNWLYFGASKPEAIYYDRCKRIHNRALCHKGAGMKTNRDRVVMPGKHRYLYPLDKVLRRELEGKALPYPRADEVLTVARQPSQVGGGSSILTRPLEEVTNG